MTSGLPKVTINIILMACRLNDWKMAEVQKWDVIYIMLGADDFEEAGGGP